ncbi:MAG TPA: fatty acid CoA ligase family protein [Pirellulales bacterium]|jgi:acyl-CoA synthetase (AMP-forming)/AMP-acid ligase II|nr:fatty acid CoA ligase family protein [Pirellulales bacterium]
MTTVVNVAGRFAQQASAMPDSLAVIAAGGHNAAGKRQYARMTFRELDRDSDRIARGLGELGVRPGTRLALLVRPGIDFISLVFALFKAGTVIILIDPGMGRQNLIGCLEAVAPEGFIAIPTVQAVRALLRRRFPRARFNVTVGQRWFWGGVTLENLRGTEWRGPELAQTRPDDPAAIIFTTGSTGPPKGVLYRHGNFDRQVEEIRDFYAIRPGEIDLACFPLFGLFNCAMGVTTVVPDMDASRPAMADPANLVEAITDWGVTQSFASPAVWNRVGPYCAARGLNLATMKRVMSAGAPVPPYVLERMKSCIGPEGEMHTPYGATEALPVASISATEVLAETAEQTRQGAGTCVGRRFAGIEWKIIAAVDGPISTLADAHELPAGEIGELIVHGPVVTREYVTRTEWNALAKIADGESFWHRMGDVGYFDDRERFWYCGRLSHRVLTAAGPMYTERCEAIFNNHPSVYRSALVGIGPKGNQRPVIVVEPLVERIPLTLADRQTLVAAVAEIAKSHPLTAAIRDVLIHPSFPVDIRHNAKIFREKLAVWAEQELNDATGAAGARRSATA